MTFNPRVPGSLHFPHSTYYFENSLATSHKREHLETETFRPKFLYLPSELDSMFNKENFFSDYTAHGCFKYIPPGGFRILPCDPEKGVPEAIAARHIIIAGSGENVLCSETLDTTRLHEISQQLFQAGFVEIQLENCAGFDLKYGAYCVSGEAIIFRNFDGFKAKLSCNPPSPLYRQLLLQCLAEDGLKPGEPLNLIRV